MAIRVLIVSNKGGPGKTTVATTAAEAAARHGYTSLVVDLDHQGNATRRLGLDRNHLLASGHAGIADVLDPDNPVPVADAVVSCGWDVPNASRIRVLPSIADLPLQRRTREHGEPGAIFRLRNALDAYDRDVHLTFIDVHPGTDHLLENAVLATDVIYLVVDLETIDGVDGGRTVAAYVLSYAPKLGRTDLGIAGVIVNKYNGDSAVQRGLLADLPAYFLFERGGEPYQIPVLPDPIPHLTTASNAQHRGVPIVTETHPVVKARLNQVIDNMIKHILSNTYAKP